jgi:hypothetical protein
MIENKKWFSNLTPLSHKEFVTFEDDKKGKVLDTGIVKVNDHFAFSTILHHEAWFPQTPHAYRGVVPYRPQWGCTAEGCLRRYGDIAHHC